MPLEIVRENIANMQVDAIVSFRKSDGIYRRADSTYREIRKVFPLVPGEAEITTISGLYASYIIHTCCPLWRGGIVDEIRLLRDCYERSLYLALNKGCESIAFPLLATGKRGFPKKLSRQIAKEMFLSFLSDHKMKIYLVISSEDYFELSQELMEALGNYIEANYMREISHPQNDPSILLKYTYYTDNLLENYDHDKIIKEINELIICSNVEHGFTETLIRLREKYGKKKSEIYTKACISRQTFNKGIKNPNWRPEKDNAIKIAMALELGIEEALDLIGRAGYYLMPNSKRDLVIKFFIENKIYDFEIINEALEIYGLDPMEDSTQEI